MSSSAESGSGSGSSSSSPFTADPGANPFGKPPVTLSHPTTYVPPPRTVTPKTSVATPLPGIEAPASLPADLNAAWRSLMSSVGVTVPYHLNRSVRVAQLMRRGSH